MFIVTEVIFENGFKYPLDQVQNIVTELVNLHGEDGIVTCEKTEINSMNKLVIRSEVEPSNDL